MFVVLIRYIQPLQDVELHMSAHYQFLQRHYANGNFLLSGRQQPRTGGIIIARASSRAEIEEILRQDPFLIAGVAEYETIEFIAGMTAPDLAFLKE